MYMYILQSHSYIYIYIYIYIKHSQASSEASVKLTTPSSQKTNKYPSGQKQGGRDVTA